MSGLPEGNEREYFDRKSLRKVVGQSADWSELASDCVGVANGSGGKLYIGIEDDQTHPPPDQHIDATLPERIRKRIGELTVGVQALPELCRDENGGEYVVLAVSRSIGVASTSDGRYFLRVGDTCKPVVGDDVLRLANERPGDRSADTQASHRRAGGREAHHVLWRAAVAAVPGTSYRPGGRAWSIDMPSGHTKFW